MAILGELRQGTAATVIIGPLTDAANGDSEMTALTITQSDIILSKNAGAFAQKNETTAAAHLSNGAYSCLLNTTDTNTHGRLTMLVHEAGALIFRGDWAIVSQQYWDAKYSTGAFSANLTLWLGTAPLALSSQRVQTEVAAIAANAVSATAIADNAITAGKIATGALTAAKFATGAFDAVWTVTARLLTAGTNIVLAKGTGVTGFNDLSAAQVNTEVDTAITDAALSTFDVTTDAVTINPAQMPPATPVTGSHGDAMKRAAESLPVYEAPGDGGGLATANNVTKYGIQAVVNVVTDAGDFTVTFENYSGNIETNGQFTGMQFKFDDGPNEDIPRTIGAYTGSATYRMQFTGTTHRDSPFPNLPVSGNRATIIGRG